MWHCVARRTVNGDKMFGKMGTELEALEQQLKITVTKNLPKKWNTIETQCKYNN